MNIPGEVLPRLICDNCELYLSCGPIYFVHDTEEVHCGRCNVSENEETKEPLKKTRVSQLEAYAKLFKYPCKYEENGCCKKLPFALTPHIHEQNCEFKLHVCPVAPSGSCDWIGRWESLEEHCKSDHPNKILENNCAFQHNFRVSKLETFLLASFNVLFLLQLKICTKTAKIYHSLRFLGDPENIKNYTFQIEIERGETKLTKAGEILAEQFLTLQETTSLQVDINSLLSIFNGALDDIKFKIIIKTSNIFCEFCGIEINERIQDDLICNDCIENVQSCKYKSKGCLIKDLGDKCEKHEQYYCKYTEKCFHCKQLLKNGENMMNHLVDFHKALPYIIGSKFRIPFANNHTRQLFILASEIGNVFCECECSTNFIQIYMSSPLIFKEVHSFECKATIEDPVSLNKQTVTFEYEYYYYYDWYKEIRLNNFTSWQRNNNGVYITININKKLHKTYNIFVFYSFIY